ncbi:hypothetical protein LEQ41_09340 [Streptococcus agalactiae]|nr:hypothetical protein [Streptococcus agalactiae]
MLTRYYYSRNKLIMQGFYVFISLISFKDIFYFSLLKYALYQTYVAIFFY